MGIIPFRIVDYDVFLILVQLKIAVFRGGAVCNFSSVARSKQQKIVQNNNLLVVYKIMGLSTLMLLHTMPSLKTAI